MSDYFDHLLSPSPKIESMERPMFPDITDIHIDHPMAMLKSPSPQLIDSHSPCDTVSAWNSPQSKFLHNYTHFNNNNSTENDTNDIDKPKMASISSNPQTKVPLPFSGHPGMSPPPFSLNNPERPYEYVQAQATYHSSDAELKFVPQKPFQQYSSCGSPYNLPQISYQQQLNHFTPLPFSSSVNYESSALSRISSIDNGVNHLAFETEQPKHCTLNSSFFDQSAQNKLRL